MNKTAINRLAGAVNQLRPEWPTSSLVSFIEANLADRDWRDAALVLVAVACDEDTRTPARVLQAGPWWDLLKPAKTEVSVSQQAAIPTCGYCAHPRSGHDIYVARFPEDDHEWQDFHAPPPADTKAFSELLRRAS